MKNLKISTKLVVGFGIMLLLLLLRVFVSAISVNSLVGQTNRYSQNTVPNIQDARSMKRDMASIQRYLIGTLVTQDAALIKNDLDSAVSEVKSLRDA